MNFITAYLQKKIKWLVKLTISLLLFVFLFFKIKNDTRLADFSDALDFFDLNKYILLIIVCILVFPNLLLESIKWKLLVGHLEKISLQRSFRAVLGGLSVSMITPNRIGEIPGRAAFISPGKRKRALFATLTGSISQSLVTVIAGLAAYFFLIFHYQFDPFPVKAPGLFFILALGLVILLIWIFITLNRKNPAIRPRIKKYLSFLTAYSAREITMVQLLSFMRYALFLTQFYLFLKLFNVNISYQEGILSISLTYLVMYFTPFLTMAEIGARGSASILCIGFFSGNIAGILLAGFALWLINLVIPAFMGTIIILVRQKYNPGFAV